MCVVGVVGVAIHLPCSLTSQTQATLSVKFLGNGLNKVWVQSHYHHTSLFCRGL